MMSCLIFFWNQMAQLETNPFSDSLRLLLLVIGFCCWFLLLYLSFLSSVKSSWNSSHNAEIIRVPFFICNDNKECNNNNSNKNEFSWHLENEGFSSFLASVHQMSSYWNCIIYSVTLLLSPLGWKDFWPIENLAPTILGVKHFSGTGPNLDEKLSR